MIDSSKMPRIDVLVLSSLARRPMHGYELKLEFRYKHVGWWARCEHGHLYASLKRLEAHKLVRGSTRRTGQRRRRVFTLTELGREQLHAALEAIALADDATHFEIDLLLASAFLLDRDRTLSWLDARQARLQEQRADAERLADRMALHVPRAARLIMQHRIEHLAREAEFAAQARAALADEPDWGPHLGDEPITSFVGRSGVPLEE